MKILSALVVISYCAGAVSAAGQEAGIQVPKHRATATAVASPINLPSGPDRIVPEAFHIAVRVQPIEAGPRTWTEKITRTVDRIHLSSNGLEWLFERNPRDPRRVSGTLIDHAAKALIFHDESDLRTMLGMDGWADALNLGFEPGFAVRRIPSRVDAAVLRKPAERFPNYKVFDLAEWLEGR